ncbi:globin-coupled sensor protein [Halobacillus salinarum]|uniref:Globin-coupled sensor protein n=1 Tax=Halobacillus salinarum TaxID=2932257 RepID=A0ABY4EQM9_9BACI|nr:globin-coupled sensor protein [Halobacillus salinarum]UOQ45977.1 globin-coupled sensor protein [Halobacillus salinarum]
MFQIFAPQKKESRLHSRLDLTNDCTFEVKKASELEKQLRMIHFTAEDLNVLKSLQPILKPHIPKMVDQFYKNLENQPLLMEIIESHSSVTKLKETLTKHIHEMFNGILDDAFIEKRSRIASIHLQIGLQPKWYMCAFQDLMVSLLSIFSEELTLYDDYRKAVRSTTKILNLEQQIVLEIYEHENLKLQEKAAEEKELAYRTIDEMAEELAAISQQASASTEQLTEQTEKILKDSQTGAQIAIQVEGQSADGKNQLDHQQKQMMLIQDSIKQITEEMNALRGVAEEISKIVTIVSSIAEQTNLLSLNASIEAARAGEHGKGFTVVANEVRKLSEQTKSSVSEVSELILSTNNQIQKVSHNVGEIDHLIVDGTENIHQINRFFTEIVEAMGQNKQNNEGIENELKTFSQVITEINDAVTQVADSSQQLTDVTSQT